MFQEEQDVISNRKLINALFCEVNPIPVRSGLDFMGYEMGKPRMPLTEMGEELLAEKHLFGKDIIADSPRLKNIQREKRNIILSFENADGGLYVDGDKLNLLKVFEGEKETPYTFVILGEQIILNLPEEINNTVTVKFARDAWYQVNLYNQGKIPAIPFEVSC